MATALRKRLEVRCTVDQREMIDKAVELSGRSITDFVLSAVQEAAVQTIKDFETMKLNTQDSLVLAKALLSPPEPNAKLRTAAERFKAAAS
jgi:uncharacterized protein (DUF1778 family)